MRRRAQKSQKAASSAVSKRAETGIPRETRPSRPSKELQAGKPSERLAEKIRRHKITDPSLQELDQLLRELRIRDASPHSFLGVLRDLKKRGRPRDIAKLKIWTEGARLRAEDARNWSWSKLTRKLDPDGYAADAQRATDRMRQGVESVLRNMPKPK